MPYPLTTDAQNKIDSIDGVSLTLLIQFFINGTEYRYSTLPLFNAKKGLKIGSKALELLNSSGQTGSLPVNIVDYDSSLREIIQTKNLMMCEANAFVIFEDLTWDDRVLVFSGRIETPFKWDENTRIVQFNILPYALEGLIPGPIVFGDMPGVHVRDDLDGLMMVSPLYCKSHGKRRRDRLNFVEHNNFFYINIDIPIDMREHVVNNVTVPIGYSLIVDNIVVKGYFKNSRLFHCTFVNDSYGMAGITSRQTVDKDKQSNNTFWTLPGLENMDGNYLRILVTLEYDIFISDERPSYMDEEVFLQSTFLVSEGSGLDTSIIPEKKKESFRYICKCSSYDSTTGKVTIDKAPHNAYGEPVLLDNTNGQIVGVYGKYPLQKTGDMYNDYAEQWSTADNAKINFINYERETIISVLPSNSVLNVFDNSMNLQLTSEYSIQLSPQTTITREGIESVWCSVSSSVGPNVIDIIKYIIENYTELSFNTSNYTALHLLHENFPIGLYYPDDVIVGAVIKDICRQACLEYTIYGGVFMLKDATSKPDITNSLTLDKSQLEIGSVSWKTSRSKDLATVLKGTWSETEYPNHINEYYEASNNIALFGEIHSNMDFPMYHAEGGIKRAITYYLDKRSNVWENVYLRCFLNGMNMYLYDRVTADMPEIGVNSGIITEFDFDIKQFSTKLQLFTGRSITGGAGFIDSSGFDGSYTLTALDNDFIRLEDARNDLPDKDYVTRDFLPALVPEEGVQVFYQFMQQKSNIKATVIAVYQQAIVIQIIHEKPLHQYTEKFGKSILGCNFICAFPEKMGYEGFQKELQRDDDDIDSVYFNEYNQAYITTKGYRYFLTPTIRKDDVISVLFNPGGFLVPLEDYTNSDKKTLSNFQIDTQYLAFSRDDNADITDSTGEIV